MEWEGGTDGEFAGLGAGSTWAEGLRREEPSSRSLDSSDSTNCVHDREAKGPSVQASCSRLCCAIGQIGPVFVCSPRKSGKTLHGWGTAGARHGWGSQI